jgi:hypothetical protein
MIMVNLMGSNPTAIAVAICPTTVPHEAFDIVFSTLVRIGLTISCYIRVSLGVLSRFQLACVTVT